MINVYLSMLIALALVPTCNAQSWAVKTTYPVGGMGGWDYLTVDPASHRLYVPRSTHTMVLNADSGKVLGDIPGQVNAHGVALVPELNRGFISDGGGKGAVVVFDLKTFAILGKIAAQPDADGIIYDPGTRLVLVVSGDGGVLMTFKPDIHPAHGSIDTSIDLGGKPEFLAANSGKAYINLEDKDEIAVVDLHSRKVLAHWPVSPGGEPVGMAMDPQKSRLFIGCRKPEKMVVMDAKDGKVLASLPIGAGVDATKFDSGKAFASCRDGSLVILAETSPGHFEVVETVKTPVGARTMGIDSRTHVAYLPTAEFEAAKPGERRPQTKPGSFMIVVVAPTK